MRSQIKTFAFYLPFLETLYTDSNYGVQWRPNSADLEGVYSSYNTMVNIMQEMFGDIVTAGEEVERGGYNDDRMQLAVPHYQGYILYFTI